MPVKPIHSLCSRLPAMSAEDYAELVADIRAHGLHEPIWLCDGKVLDGRHRAKACEDAGVEPRYRDYEGDAPAAFVMGTLKRRHLDASQRAVIALEFMPKLEAEAKKRKTGRHLKAVDDKSVGHTAQTNDQDDQDDQDDSRRQKPTPGRAADEAAALAGASSRNVRRAKKVRETAPELLPKVLAGEISLGKAERQAAGKGQVKYPKFPVGELMRALATLGTVSTSDAIGDIRQRKQPDSLGLTQMVEALEGGETKLRAIREGIQMKEDDDDARS